MLCSSRTVCHGPWWWITLLGKFKFSVSLAFCAAQIEISWTPDSALVHKQSGECQCIFCILQFGSHILHIWIFLHIHDMLHFSFNMDILHIYFEFSSNYFTSFIAYFLRNALHITLHIFHIAHIILRTILHTILHILHIMHIFQHIFFIFSI